MAIQTNLNTNRGSNPETQEEVEYEPPSKPSRTLLNRISTRRS
jgi:hypothetical protein